jgi:hypothetical protein
MSFKAREDLPAVMSGGVLLRRLDYLDDLEENKWPVPAKM